MKLGRFTRSMCRALFGLISFLRKRRKTKVFVFVNGELRVMDMQGNTEPILTSPTPQWHHHHQDSP